MTEYDSRIPEKLQLLRVGLGGKDDLAVFAYYPSAQQTNFANPSFCLAPSSDDPDTMDVSGAIEQTLHDLLDYGATADDVRQVMGLVPESELDATALEHDECIAIDLGWCVDGYLLGFEKLNPEASDVHAILNDAQIARIEELFDATPAKECLAEAVQVAHDPSCVAEATTQDPLADLTTGRWRAHLVMPGEPHATLASQTGYVTYEKAEAERLGGSLPLVEFYDVESAAVGPVPTPVNVFYMSDLLGGGIFDHVSGWESISLDPAGSPWKIEGDDLKRVADWLDTAHEALRGSDGDRAPEEANGAVSLADMEQSNRDAADALAGHETHDAREADTR